MKEKNRLLTDGGNLAITTLGAFCGRPYKKEIDEAHVDMRSKYEETLELIGSAAPVSVPG